MTIRRIILSVMATASLGILQAEDLEIARYEVLPGNYYKHFGTTCDNDLIRLKDGTIGRRGLLTDGRTDYAPATGICYVFWLTEPKQSFVTFQLELKQLADVEKVIVHGQNPMGRFKAEYVTLDYGMNGVLDMTSAGTCAHLIPENIVGINWKIEAPCTLRAKYLNVTVWTHPDYRLNVTEIKVQGRRVTSEHGIN